MPSDQLTKTDITKASAALEQLLRTGVFRLLLEAAGLEARRALPWAANRSQGHAGVKLLQHWRGLYGAAEREPGPVRW